MKLASHWLCEICADLFFNLDALGFCPGPEDDMRELVKEYADYYGMKNYEGDTKPDRND